MVKHESFEVYCNSKLEEIVIQLKDILKSDVPYATRAEYACIYCSYRIKVHSHERMYCLQCNMPLWWPAKLREEVNDILQHYPCREQWQASPVPLGKIIREERKKRGWTCKDLAMHIYKNDGNNISSLTIYGYESLRSKPGKEIVEQLKQVLELDV
jgi:hypothetical protein